MKDDSKLFFNAAIELSDNAEVYAFGNYAERNVEGGFFYRNLVGGAGNLGALQKYDEEDEIWDDIGTGQRGGVYRGPIVDPLTGLAIPRGDDNKLLVEGGVRSILVGDMDSGSSCIDGIPLGGTGGVTPDAGFLASVTADDNCFSFIETIPTGFVPRFGGDNEDSAFAIGVRGELAMVDGLSYDLSAQRGSNRTDFFIRNTINASLGPDTPRDFVPGGQKQTETVYNLNFVYAVDAGFASDLNVAFGAEYREEEFDLYAGDAASYALGPLASQGFSSSSNGFGGFPRDTSAKQDSTAFYVDLETDVTDALTIQTAVRYEDFSAFGDTTDFKLAGLLRLSEQVRLRAAYSTGFHAPTSGQASITNVTTQISGGVLVDQGTLPLFSAAGQLSADFVESAGNGRPELGTEDATNYSFGIAFDLGNSSWTIDYYNIEVEDRVALGANIDFLKALAFAGSVTEGEDGFTSVSEALTTLDAAGTIDRQQFVGLDDLKQFRFFSNSFDTTTSGVDVVGNIDFSLGDGESTITVAANFNNTDVDSRGTVNPIGAGRVESLEDLLPSVKGNVAWRHSQGKIRTLVRANYYGGWKDTGNGYDVGAETLFDAQVAYDLTDKAEVVLGVENLFDAYPDENPGAGGTGQLYPEASPFGFMGSTWYVQGRYVF